MDSVYLLQVVYNQTRCATENVTWFIVWDAPYANLWEWDRPSFIYDGVAIWGQW